MAMKTYGYEDLMAMKILNSFEFIQKFINHLREFYMSLSGNFITCPRFLSDLINNDKRKQNIELVLTPGKKVCKK
jgi:hypothetical protein